MKKLITLLLALPLFIMAQAQDPAIAIQVVASGGGYVHNATLNRSLSWTVGQTAYTTLTSSAYIITQGFQQPDLLDVMTYTIQGRVKDSQGYLSGVDVILQGETVATDAEGTFIFTELEEGAYTLSIEHDGYYFYTTVVNTDQAVDGLVDLGDITLDAITYTVQGKVKDADGYLSGVQVQLGNSTATTASNGAFTFTNLPAGLYTLSIEHNGYYAHSQTVSTDDAVDEVLVLNDITLMPIEPDVYMVVGKVKDAQGYLANINVQLDAMVATTDAGGLFTFNNVQEGNYTLTIDVDGYELHSQTVSTTQAVEGVVNLGDITLIAILPDTYTVKGKVKDAEGYLTNINVQLDGLVSTTDASGLFTFSNVEEGNYTLTIDVDGYELHTQAVSTTQAVEGVVDLGDILLIATDVDQILFTDITVYPNPFSHTLNISNAHLVRRVVITNILGQNMLDVMLENNSTINTEVLNTGIYLITLQGYNNEVVVRRVVKR